MNNKSNIDNKNISNKELFNEDLKNGYLTKNSYDKVLSKINNNLNKVNKSEKISIIIPTHNRVKQLKECIDSIYSQTYQNFEIIIIDDCSEDETNSIYSTYEDNRLKYILNENNLGNGLTRQKGFNAASGDFVIFIDDDDYFIDDEYFNKAIKIFENKSIDIICSNSYTYYESEDIYKRFTLNLNGLKSCADYLNNFQIKYLKPTSSFPAIFRKKTLDKANFSNMKMMNDSSIYLRALAYGNLVYFNKEIIGVYRVHSANFTYNVKADYTIENLEEKIKVYKEINTLLKKPKRWIFNEVRITVCYFLLGREKNNSEIKKVLDWTKQNLGFLPYLYFKVYKLLK